MAEELLGFLFFVNFSVLALLFYCWTKLGKEMDEAKEIRSKYFKHIINFDTAFWKDLGAYETENDKMYLDLEGIRLVIFEGKIEGWYIP